MENEPLKFDPIILMNPKRIIPPYSWIGHIPFAFFLVKHQKPRVIVELGTHSGNSYFSFCQVVESLKLETKCYAIDTWKGDVHAGFYDESIFEEVSKYNEFNYSHFSTLIRKTFDEAINLFQNESIDLLHIDGLHTYKAVKHDFTNWLPKVKNDGVILLHDTEVYLLDFGVWKFWQEIKDEYPSFNFRHSNGLGVVSKGSRFPPTLDLFNQQEKRNQLKVLIQGALQNYKKIESKMVQNADESAIVKVYFRSEEGMFNEKNTLTQKIRKFIPQTISFEMPDDIQATYFRFDPTENPVAISINTIEIKYKAENSPTHLNGVQIWANSDYQFNNFYFFFKKDPQVYINPTSITDEKIERVIIGIEYLIDEDIIKTIILNKQFQRKPFRLNGRYKASRKIKIENLILKCVEEIKKNESNLQEEE